MLRRTTFTGSSQNFVDECLIPNPTATRFLSEPIEHLRSTRIAIRATLVRSLQES
jgi:hypothetical protein